MLYLKGLWTFQKRETMDKLARFSQKNPGCFETELVETCDHLGVTTDELFLYTPYAQYSCSPFNSFHYLGDYEISLTAAPTTEISEIESSLSRNGFQFESGFFDKEKERYYCIPRREDIYTPFHITINKGEDCYLMALKHLEMTVNEQSYETTRFFLDEFITKKDANVILKSGPGNSLERIEFAIENSYDIPHDYTFDNLHMTFVENRWIINTDY